LEGGRLNIWIRDVNMVSGWSGSLKIMCIMGNSSRIKKKVWVFIRIDKKICLWDTGKKVNTSLNHNYKKNMINSNTTIKIMVIVDMIMKIEITWKVKRIRTIMKKVDSIINICDCVFILIIFCLFRISFISINHKLICLKYFL